MSTGSPGRYKQCYDNGKCYVPTLTRTICWKSCFCCCRENNEVIMWVVSHKGAKVVFFLDKTHLFIYVEVTMEIPGWFQAWHTKSISQSLSGCVWRKRGTVLTCGFLWFYWHSDVFIFLNGTLRHIFLLSSRNGQVGVTSSTNIRAYSLYNIWVKIPNIYQYNPDH